MTLVMTEVIQQMESNCTNFVFRWFKSCIRFNVKSRYVAIFEV